MAGNQADVCPYSRPFPADFDECPAFQPAEFIALDIRYEPLPPVWTCRHLAAKSLHWVEEVRRQRLDKIRALGVDLSQATRELLPQLWAAKGDELRKLAEGLDVSEEMRALDEIRGRYMKTAKVFFEERSAVLAEINLPLDLVLQLVDAALADFVGAKAIPGQYRVPDELLDRFPEDVRVILRPTG
jgi:hypothetical protein